jgi:hypothetical protein
MITVHEVIARHRTMDYVLQPIDPVDFNRLIKRGHDVFIYGMPAYYTVVNNQILVYPKKRADIKVHVKYTSDDPNEQLRPP